MSSRGVRARGQPPPSSGGLGGGPGVVARGQPPLSSGGSGGVGCRGGGHGGGRGVRARGQPPPSSGGLGGGGGRGEGQGGGGQPPPSSGGSGGGGGRGGGHGGGRGVRARGQPPPSSGGSGGVGGRRIGHGGFYVPPPQRTPASPATRISAEMEQKLTLPASSSTQPVAPQPPARPVSSESLRPPLRPDPGTWGRKVFVKANHFLVSVADRDLCHYDVSISPKVLSSKVCRDIMNELVKTFKASALDNKELAYDGMKNCYTAGELPFKAKDFWVTLKDKDGSVRRERKFQVSIKFASKADTYHLQQFIQGRQLDYPQGTLQFLNVVLKQSPSNMYRVIGRSFFDRKLDDYGELGNDLEYWKGFYQSLRPTQMGLSLNINTSTKVFYKPICVSDYVCKCFNIDLRRPLSNKVRLKVEKALKGIRVETHHLGRINRHKIVNLSTKTTQQLTFTLDGSSETKFVVQHFRQKYKIELEYPNLPALQVGLGRSAKLVYLPMEICTIVDGQRYTKKLNERQVTSLLNATCQRPSVRERNISEMVERNNYKGNDIVKEFGINVDSQFTLIEARVLPTPMLKYHDTGRFSSITPISGQWNMIGKKMINGGKVDYWTCIDFSRPGSVDSERFCEELISMCLDKGMTFSHSPLVNIRRGHSDQIEKSLISLHAEACAKLSKENAKRKYLQLLIIILPELSGSYGTIKRVCETKLGIVTQCCLPKHALRCQKQYLENVALKINLKVGGRNSVLEPPFTGDDYGIEGYTIIFGADVYHPPPGEDSKPSIAAVVASMDWPGVTTYRGLVSAQPCREEIIKDLFSQKQDPKGVLVSEGMIRDHLMAFYKSNKGKMPQQLIFYRDGVGEGQFSQVLLHEVDAIRKACASINEIYMPRITFVVVQKRHHTRFFPANHTDRQTTDESGNILPGTVVDTKICHPFEFDFYLCSHAGIKGTSRPAHYHVLYDENNFTPDQLQKLTNDLCYTNARCTRSLSIVPPAYYAHLAAYRAHHYIEDIESCDSGLPLIKENVRDVMFYC